MVWKPKERELTAEEAIALAKKELAPFWSGSEPLLAPIAEGTKITLYPLSPEVSQKAWLLLFIDPTDPRTDTLVEFAKEWLRRYQNYQFGVLGFLQSRFKSLVSPSSLFSISRRLGTAFPLVIDNQGLVSKAFQASVFPHLVLLQSNLPKFSASADTSLTEFETRLQAFFRESDPGLSLRPPIQQAEGQLKSFRILDFTRESEGARPSLSGTWKKEADFLSTEDPKATVTFRAPAKNLWLLGNGPNPANRGKPLSRVCVEVNGAPAYEALHGEALITEDDGSANARLEELQLYHLLSGLELGSEVQLSFPNAKEAPPVLYGVRFGG